MNDNTFLILLTTGGLVHGGLFSLNRRWAAKTGSHAIDAITCIANLAAVVGWIGLVLFIAIAQGRPVGYSVPAEFGGAFLFVGAAFFWHGFLAVTRGKQRDTTPTRQRTFPLAVQPLFRGFVAIATLCVKTVGLIVVWFIEAASEETDEPSLLSIDNREGVGINGDDDVPCNPALEPPSITGTGQPGWTRGVRDTGQPGLEDLLREVIHLPYAHPSGRCFLWPARRTGTLDGRS